MRHKMQEMLLLCSLFWGTHTYALEEVKRMEFQIRDPQTHALIFQGTETVSGSGGKERKETLYFDLNKKELYREEALYESQTLRMLDYSSRNHLTGEDTLLKDDGARALVEYRPSSKDKPKKAAIELGEKAFHPKMIHQLIVRNWQQLLQGKAYKFNLVLPFRFETLGFQLVHNRSLKVGQEERESFLMQPQNFLLRAFVPRMEFQFARGPEPQVRLYLGPCPVPVNGETNKTLEMIFLTGEARSGV